MPLPVEYNLEPFFAVVAEEVLPELRKLDAASVGIRHWFVTRNPVGVSITTADEELDYSAALAASAKAGADAAYVTYVPGPPSEHILAYAVLAGPTNSDVRRSSARAVLPTPMAMAY